MFLSNFILAMSVSIDSLGIGITYGLKNTKISNYAKVILFMISILITTLSISIGNIVYKIFSSFITNLIGASFLILIGLWMIYQTLKKPEINIKNIESNSLEPKVYKIFIQSLRNYYSNYS